MLWEEKSVTLTCNHLTAISKAHIYRQLLIENATICNKSAHTSIASRFCITIPSAGVANTADLKTKPVINRGNYFQRN